MLLRDEAMSDTDQQPEVPLAVPVAEATPPSVSRRHLLMGAGMLAVGGAAFARMPQRRYKSVDDKKFEALFPKAFGDWRTLPVSELIMPPEGDMTDKLYEHILTRTYVNSKGEGIMFLVAYNSLQVNNVQVHRPEICYSVSGFKIAQTRPYDLALGDGHSVPGRVVRAERTARTENILYWTRIGDEFPQTWLQQRVSMTKANLNGFYADGMLVRASIIDSDTEDSVTKIAQFLREMAAASPPQTRQLVFRA